MQPTVQILGLRPYWNEQRQREEITDNTYFKRNWRAPSVPELLRDLETYMALIPEKDRWNLFYTVAKCGAGKREFVEQNVLIFDVDGISDEAKEDHNLLRLYTSAVCDALGVMSIKIGIVFSGNGLHFIIALKDPITDSGFFEENRRHYLAICARIDSVLRAEGLPGSADPAVFDPRRIMRLPGTINIKKDRPQRTARLLGTCDEVIDFDIRKRSGLPEVVASDQVTAEALARYPKADTSAVISGCDFLKHCKTSPNAVNEAQWYASLSIIGRLKDGRELAHEFSRGYKSYSAGETDSKLKQALDASGPRTCKNIQNLWGKCEACPNFGKQSSPILIKGEKFIATENNGFHSISTDQHGNPKPGKPVYEDLRLFFERERPYVTTLTSGSCLTWTGKYWKQIADRALESFAQEHFDPKATTNMTMEFKNLMLRTNLRDDDFFSTTAGKINFDNGILDLQSLELVPHSQEHGFRYVLPYSYDPKAMAPRFEQFLSDIMLKRHDLVDVLLEYAGYCFSNDSCWSQKALILTGVGSNGKSTFMNVLKQLAGPLNFSSVTLGDLKSEVHRAQLEGKLFNLAEETPSYSVSDSSTFKNLVSGGHILVKQLYKQPYTIVNKTKLMFACNELPQTKDTTAGFFRRLIVVPFDRNFSDAEADKSIEEKLFAELPGIFNLVIRGYQRLRAQGRFTAAESIQRQISEYQHATDTVLTWYKAHVSEEKNPALERTMKDLYGSYSIYAEDCGEKPETMSVFGKRLKRILPAAENRWDRKVIQGVRHTVVRGLRLGAVEANF